ncbi:MAG: anhydro-N-acetylmuramic acid kinase [Phycisphaerales bacterium]|nr:anhydro-N-acetylmuramic acid kinase [Phycisphaerales bacterium]MDB5299583.1 anhydro-N-acetylmuramic acid kinase [Phycisphaerales bacterium]
MRVRHIVGAMSGTSGDGVDVALVRIDGHGLEMAATLVRHVHRPYNDALRRAIFEIRGDGRAELRALADLGREITLSYARAVNDLLTAAQFAVSDVAAIAAHGQTLFHDPPNTIQWFDPSLLAYETGCVVVSDFRRADCAAGGQGAPLVPFADYLLFRHATKSRVLLNIGGIANLTFVPAGASIDQLIAFDTGPGNCISDWICRHYGPFGMSWDVDGAGASRGRVIEDAVKRFLSHPYFAGSPPKSTDGPTMINAFLESTGPTQAEMNDLLATAAYMTAATIAEAVSKFIGNSAPALEWLVSGGGIHNKAIMGWLRSMLGGGASMRPTNELEIPTEAKEAIAFALLGAATLDGFPSNVPNVTGAKRPAVLGSITPRT